MDTITSGQRGELGWLQAGVYARQPLPVPLLVHAATRSISQLGRFEFDVLQIQVPFGSHAGGDHRNALLGQFAALANVRPHITIRARVFTSKPHRPWSELALKWFEHTHIEPFAVTDIKASASVARFDNRWELRAPKGTCEAVITTPEWSPAAAAAVVLIMLEAAQAAGINGTVIVEVARVSK